MSFQSKAAICVLPVTLVVLAVTLVLGSCDVSMAFGPYDPQEIIVRLENKSITMGTSVNSTDAPQVKPRILEVYKHPDGSIYTSMHYRNDRYSVLLIDRDDLLFCAVTWDLKNYVEKWHFCDPELFAIFSKLAVKNPGK